MPCEFIEPWKLNDGRSFVNHNTATSIALSDSEHPPPSPDLLESSWSNIEETISCHNGSYTGMGYGRLPISPPGESPVNKTTPWVWIPYSPEAEKGGYQQTNDGHKKCVLRSYFPDWQNPEHSQALLTRLYFRHFHFQSPFLDPEEFAGKLEQQCCKDTCHDAREIAVLFIGLGVSRFFRPLTIFLLVLNNTVSK